MAAKATQASHTFLTLIPTTNIAHKPSVAEPAQTDIAVEGVNLFEVAPKTTRSVSTSTDDSAVSPRSSVDGGSLKNGGFLRLGI